jgi:hypothetical protein
MAEDHRDSSQAAKPSETAAVSPLATGGAGTVFEYRVAAVVLAALLRHDGIIGLGGPVETVGLQQRALGYQLDDIVVKGLTPSGMELVVENQVKRDLHPVASNDDFRAVIRQSLTALEQDAEGFAHGRHRLGLIAGGQLPQIRDLHELADIARAQATAESFRAVLPSSRGSLGERYEQLCSTIRAVSSDSASGGFSEVEVYERGWRVLRALEVWVFETNDHSREVSHATDRLRDLIPAGEAPFAAERLFLELANIAETWGPRAGFVDSPMLRAELERRGVALSSDPREQAGLAVLLDESARFLASVPTTLGQRRYLLEREQLLEQIVERNSSQAALLLYGTAGAGKTALAARAAQRLRDLGATIVAFSLTGRRGQSLADLEGRLGARLRSALRAAPTTGLRVVFIDGAEQVLADAGALLLDVLRAIPMNPQEAPSWHVVILVRDEAAEAVSDFVTQALEQIPTRLLVGDLTDEEVEEVRVAFPALAPLYRDPRSLRLLRRPYVVDLLVRATASGTMPDAILAEEDVLDLVFERLVRLRDGALPGRGAADSRSDLYLAMADAVIADQRPAELRGQDAEARQGLVSDDILRRTRASFDFAHDILADYAVASRLLEPNGEAQLMASPSPRRLLRAMRLWMQHRLARAGNADVVSILAGVEEIAAQLAAADGPRWVDVPYEALLNLGRPRDVLEALRPHLLGHDAAALSRLMDVTERLARLGQGAGTVAREAPLDTGLAAAVVGLLARCAAGIPEALWLAAARLTRRTLDEIARMDADLAILIPEVGALSEALRGWAGDPERRDSTGDVLLGLALLGRNLDDAGKDFLRNRAHRRPHSLDVVVEDPRAGQVLAEHHPDCLLALAGAYYLNQELTLDSARPLPSRRRAQDAPWRITDPFQGDGVRRHSGRLQVSHNMAALAHPSLGPFSALLGASERHGLRLIGRLVDEASAARCLLEAAWGAVPIALDLQIEGWPAARTYRGTTDIWLWYRRLGVGPYPAMSALMALRDWALKEVAVGRDLRSMLDAVLGCGESVAFVAVGYSLLVERLADLPAELDDLLAHPLIWDLENSRAAREYSALALPVAQESPLKYEPSKIAMALVMWSDAERREKLKRVGERLIASPERLPAVAPLPRLDGEVGETPAEAAEREQLLRRRWAVELDASKYGVVRISDEKVQVSVNHPRDVMRGLAERGGQVSAQVLELSNLGVRAVGIRDGDLAGDPLVLWNRLHALADEIGSGPGQAFAAARLAEARSACAAALLLGAEGVTQVSDAVLGTTARELLASAEAVRRAGLGQDPFGDRDMRWELGADRSAATALPRLVKDGSLRTRCGVSTDEVSRAIVALAASASAEVRARLTAGLVPVWSDGCREGSSAHETALAGLRELVATAGLGPWDQHGHRPRARLAEPLEVALGGPGLVIMPESAADALPGLIAAAQCDCAHGRTAAQLLEALVDFDLRIWPAELAREPYEFDTWRATLDRLTAERALDGQPSQLRRYLQAFAPVAEDLRGLLTALAVAAVTPERAAALHDLWPEIFDALLPGVRTLNRRVGDKPANHRHVDALDDALLPLPPEGSEWPLQRTGELFGRWVSAFRGAAHVGDRCMKFLFLCGWMHSPNAIAAVLIVLGNDVERIRQECFMVVPWLRGILRAQPPRGGVHAPALRGLLDRLASDGDEAALALQRELEA